MHGWLSLALPLLTHVACWPRLCHGVGKCLQSCMCQCCNVGWVSCVLVCIIMCQCGWHCSCVCVCTCGCLCHMSHAPCCQWKHMQYGCACSATSMSTWLLQDQLWLSELLPRAVLSTGFFVPGPSLGQEICQQSCHWHGLLVVPPAPPLPKDIHE